MNQWSKLLAVSLNHIIIQNKINDDLEILVVFLSAGLEYRQCILIFSVSIYCGYVFIFYKL